MGIDSNQSIEFNFGAKPFAFDVSSMEAPPSQWPGSLPENPFPTAGKLPVAFASQTMIDEVLGWTEAMLQQGYETEEIEAMQAADTDSYDESDMESMGYVEDEEEDPESEDDEGDYVGVLTYDDQ